MTRPAVQLIYECCEIDAGYFQTRIYFFAPVDDKDARYEMYGRCNGESKWTLWETGDSLLHVLEKRPSVAIQIASRDVKRWCSDHVVDHFASRVYHAKWTGHPSSVCAAALAAEQSSSR